jgi:hypothetical protein
MPRERECPQSRENSLGELCHQEQQQQQQPQQPQQLLQQCQHQQRQRQRGWQNLPGVVLQ